MRSPHTANDISNCDLLPFATKYATASPSSCTATRPCHQIQRLTFVAGNDIIALASSASSLSNTGLPSPLGVRRTTHVTSPPHESPRTRTSLMAVQQHENRQMNKQCMQPVCWYVSQFQLSCRCEVQAAQELLMHDHVLMQMLVHEWLKGKTTVTAHGDNCSTGWGYCLAVRTIYHFLCCCLVGTSHDVAFYIFHCESGLVNMAVNVHDSADISKHLQ